MRTQRLLVAALAAALVLALPARAARAQGGSPTPDAQAIEQAKKHFAKGQELYQAGDKQGAVEEFKEAYKLSKNPVLLYNIGFVYDELGDKPLALHYYTKFLELAPDNEKTKETKPLATERVKVLKREIAEEEAAAAKGQTTPPDDGGGQQGGGKKPAGGVTEFTHSVVDEAPPGKPLDITAKIPVDADWRLTLYYRTAGADEFKAVKMRQRYDEMVGRIPPEDVRGGSIQYYIEVKDPGGKLIASSGRASSPNVVFLDADAKPHYYSDLSEGGSGRMVGDEEEEEEDDDDDDDDDDEPGKKKKGPVGPRDENRTMTYARWATTGGAVAFLGGALAFYLIASSKATELEGIAYESQNPQGNNGRCPNGSLPPCTQFSDYHAGLESDGDAYETWANVTFLLGVGSAVAAGVLWYMEIKKQKPAAAERPVEESRSRVRIVGAPMIGPDVIGGAAVLEW